jgi:hypothetical protein
MALTKDQQDYSRSRDALLDTRQAVADGMAATRFANEQKDRGYKDTVNNAYTDMTVPSTLDLAKQDRGLDTRQTFYDKAVDENLKTIDDPAAREIARQAALKGVADDRAFATDALASSFNSDDYSAAAYGRAEQEAISKGLKGADVAEYAKAAVTKGLLQQPSLQSKAEMAKARESAITSTDNQLKTQLSVLNALNGRQEIVNDNGDTVSISSTPTRGALTKSKAIDALTAVDTLNKYDNITGSWYKGNPAKSFTDDLQTAYNSLMEKGVPTTDANGNIVIRKPTPEELDKALTPGVVAAYAANPSQDTLMDRMSTVISSPKGKEGRLTDEAISGITKLQERLAALRKEPTPSYITMRNEVLSPTMYPNTPDYSSAPASTSVAPAAPKSVLNTEGTSISGADTQKPSFNNVQDYLSGHKTSKVASEAIKELTPEAIANGVSPKDLNYIRENGDVDKLLEYIGRQGSSGIGALANKAGLVINDAATGLGGIGTYIAAIPEYATSPASYNQALNNIGLYHDLVDHSKNVNDRLDRYRSKEQVLAELGLTPPKPSVNSIFTNDFFTPEELDEMAKRQALKASAK